MSCFIRNIDAFCKNFISVSFNSGSFNNTSVEVQILGGSEELSLDGDLFSLKNDFGNVLPFLEEEFKVTKAKTSKSESGVITSYSLQDHASLLANSYMVGLTGRIGGDVMIGDEYYSVRGFPDPEGLGIPQDLLFSRSRLLSVYNRVKDGSYYIDTSGSIRSNPKHYKNDQNSSSTGGMIGGVPDPMLEHGEILYSTGDLFGSSPMPLPTSELQNVLGLYSDTGSFFSVMNSILSRFSKIFVANPFLGGFFVHSLGSDFGKKEVLEDAGVIIPDSAISSSMEKDYMSGYSSGAFIRTWSTGKNPPFQPDYQTGGNAHTMEISFEESDADDTDAIIDLKDALQAWGSNMDSNDPSDTYSYRLPSQTQWQADAFSVEQMHSAGLAQEYELAYGAYRGDSGCIRVSDPDEKLNMLQRFSEFKDQEGNIDVNNWEVFKNAGDLVEWVESWGKDPDEISTPGPKENCYLNEEANSGERIDPAVLDYFLRNQHRWQLKSDWEGKPITRNGDIAGWAGTPLYRETFSYETLGTSVDPRGSKKWWTDEDVEVSFMSVLTQIKDSPFEFFAKGEDYEEMAVKQFLFEEGEGTGVGIPSLNSAWDGESEALQGIILTDRGEKNNSYSDVVSNIINNYSSEKSFYSNYSFSHLPSEDYKQDILVFPLYGGEPIVFNILESLKEYSFELFDKAGWSEVINPIGLEINDVLRYYGSGDKTSPIYKQIEIPGKGFHGQKFWVPGQLTVKGNQTNPNHVGRVLRHNSLTGQSGCIHPNRNLKTFSAELTTDFRANGTGYNRYYGSDGKINLNAYSLFLSQGPACVESLDRIEFTLVGELIDFSSNDWIDTKKYLESMSISVNNGVLTANYSFSQKVMLPDHLGISAARASRMNLIL